MAGKATSLPLGDQGLWADGVQVPARAGGGAATARLSMSYEPEIMMGRLEPGGRVGKECWWDHGTPPPHRGGDRRRGGGHVAETGCGVGVGGTPPSFLHLQNTHLHQKLP